MTIKPAISFIAQDSDPQLITDTQTILTAMTGNAAYPTPTPTLAAITTALKEFSDALANAADAGKQATLIKKQKRATLDALLRELAIYLHLTCKNDLPTLMSSGFPCQKSTRTPAGSLPVPATPVLSQGSRSGEIDVSTRPIANASIYNWRIALATAPDDYLQQSQTTAASNTFEGLTPGQAYQVDVSAVGTAGPSGWSDTAQMIVI